MTGFVSNAGCAILAVCIATVLSLASASAQAVSVRTGEHGDFTRIVVDFRQRPDWNLGRSGDGYELKLDDPDVRFDLSDAFRRLQGRRIAGLRDLGQGRLAIELICDCALSVEVLPNEGLLIDVADGPPTPDNPWAGPIQTVQGLAPQGRPASLEQDRSSLLPVILPALPAKLALGQLSGRTEDVLTESELSRVRNLQTGLLEQTARAATQGLISLEREAAIIVRPRAEDRQKQTSGVVADDLPADLAQPLASNILIETQLDRDGRAAKGNRIREQMSECVDPRLVDVGAWFFDDAVLDMLGEARMNLLDVRDRPDPEAHAILARMLIYLTFGLEARAVLAQGPASIPNRGVLTELATLVEGDALNDTPILHSQANCESPAALWALLASPQARGRAEVNEAAIVRSLSSFPDHLRQHLGPRIAQKFVDMGDRESALQIRNAVERGGSEDLPEVKMLQARLDRAAGDELAANSGLVEVAASRSVQAADALTLLIENQIAAGRGVSDGLIEQAAAMAFEAGDDPQAARLRIAIIQALIHQSQFDEALDQLSNFTARNRIDARTADRLMAQALTKLAETADDVAFLKTAMRLSMNGQIAEGARLAVASRLVQLGLAGEARAALGTRADIPSEDERHVLAEIAILESKRSVAMSYLTGLASETANELRARADQLQTLSGTLPPNPERVEEVAGAEGQTVPGDIVAIGDLARNRELLTESREIRENLLALLRQQPD